MAELGSVKRNGLIAGDYPTKVESITVTGPAEFQRGDVIGETGAGAHALADSSKSDGSEKVVGVICDTITVADGETTVSTMYVKGEFARSGLRFGGADTYENHKRRMTEIGLLVKETKAEGGAY